jgi:hypothetical protein
MIEPCRKSGFTLNIAERSLVEESHPQKIASCLPVIRSEPQQYQQGRGEWGNATESYGFVAENRRRT